MSEVSGRSFPAPAHFHQRSSQGEKNQTNTESEMSSCPTSYPGEWSRSTASHSLKTVKKQTHKCKKVALVFEGLIDAWFQRSYSQWLKSIPPSHPHLIVRKQCLKVAFITLPILSNNKLCIYHVSRLLRNEMSLHLSFCGPSNVLKLCAHARSSGIRPFVMS